MATDPALITILAGSALDTLLGDPYSLPHPIRLYGNLISWGERWLNRGRHRRIKGGALWLTLCAGSWGAFAAAEHLLTPYPIAGTIFNSIFFYYAISNRCLIEEGLKVERVLESGDISAARTQLSMIVGRETRKLQPTQIRSSVVETLSENLSDGVIAPLLCFAIGGIPLMMLYKMVNTLDSMVGYKSERYKDFGFVSAKMDDLFNLIPARLTAAMMALVSLSPRAIKFIFKYGRSHTSPNSAYPESALAGILNCRLGGPNEYFGKMVEKPYIGENPRELTHEDVIKCCRVNGKVMVLAVIILALIIIL
ncbi:MAG: adenosylcobinamide-phosphate synthase CbiB [Rikenellaceae bacterium]